MTLSADEYAMLISLEAETQQIKSQTDIISQDMPYQSFYILREGWAIRYKLLNNGKRQILNFLLPGDCAGLPAMVFRQADHTVTTVTPTNVSLVNPAQLMELFRRHPRVGAALYWELSQEKALVAEHLVNIGRRDAYTRLGHLFVELFWRLDAVGLIQDHAYDLPLNQTLLADALGLTPVHISRTLQRLRQDELIDLNGHRVVILDLERLEKVVHFKTAYLHLTGMPIWLRRRLNHEG